MANKSAIAKSTIFSKIPFNTKKTRKRTLSGGTTLQQGPLKINK